ncbi:MAG: rpmC [Candidatus Saccharibacteria bacterium]|nr:rpmC [Candidatus Saccharibacteria bacterium]
MAKTTTTKKTTKATEVKTIAELRDELTKLQLEHLESRKSHKQGELVNPHVLTVQRKNIARAHTAIAAASKAEAQSKTSTLKEEK